MASPPTANLHSNNGNMPKSRYQTTVCLDDWWLVKAENDLQGTRIAIGGQTVGGKLPMRVFSYLPIHKRYSLTTLETTDDKCIIIEGFINKDRSAENGFSADVCTIFLSGFPSYWKEYAEKFMVKKSPCKDVSGVNYEELSTCYRPNLNSHDNNLGSQGTMDTHTKRKSKRTKSTTVPLLQTTNSVISASDEIITGSFSVENRATQEVPINYSEGKVDIFTFTDKDQDNSSILESGVSLTACYLNNRNRSRHADDGLGKKKLVQNNSLEQNLTHTRGRPKTHSASRSKMKKNDQTSTTGLCGSADKTNSVKDNFKKLPETTTQVKDMEKVKTNGNLKTGNDKARNSFSTHVATNTEKKTVIASKCSLFENAEEPDLNPRRKLIYETPVRENEKVSVDLSPSSSFKRSRSGRLLVPVMEFWRNQRAIYSTDRTITGIEEGLHLRQPRMGKSADNLNSLEDSRSADFEATDFGISTQNFGHASGRVSDSNKLPKVSKRLHGRPHKKGRKL